MTPVIIFVFFNMYYKLKFHICVQVLFVLHLTIFLYCLQVDEVLVNNCVLVLDMANV